MSVDQDIARIALASLPRMTVSLAKSLARELGTPAEIMNATEAEFRSVEGTTSTMASAQKRHMALERARAEVEYILQKGIKAHWHEDLSYPQRLLNCKEAPAVIYTLGDCDLNKLRIVGLVGTRHATAYGNSVTEQIVNDLSEKVEDIATVSGLAYGIDVAAHRASLSKSVPTVGVVAHGLSQLYPAAHRDIAARMVRNGGMILTDYMHDVEAFSPNFLARNRIIAALSHALVVVESAEHGGALATARHAKGCGTPVFAVPGRVTDKYSTGCNVLIANHTATCATCADDIIKALGWPMKSGKKEVKGAVLCSELSAEERRLLHHIITNENSNNDTLTMETGIAPSRVMILMTGLEMRGIVALQPGNRYQVIQTIDPAELLIK